MKVSRHLPNLFTISRLLLLPFIVHALIHSHFLTALVLFGIGSLTDLIDGQLARRFNAVTPIGRILDPLADKIYLLVSYATLLFLQNCPTWFLALMISTMALQCAGFLILKVAHQISEETVKPILPAKFNTALQMAWIVVLYVDLWLRKDFPRNFIYSESFHLIGFSVLAIAQLIVFFQYVLEYRPQILAYFHRATISS